MTQQRKIKVTVGLQLWCNVKSSCWLPPQLELFHHFVFCVCRKEDRVREICHIAPCQCWLANLLHQLIFGASDASAKYHQCYSTLSMLSGSPAGTFSSFCVLCLSKKCLHSTLSMLAGSPAGSRNRDQRDLESGGCRF